MNQNIFLIQIALLKLLLTSTPTAKPKTESINILCDVIPEEMPCSMVQTMKLGFDINRHKVKKLLLQYFHIYHNQSIGNDRQSCFSYFITSFKTS